MNRNIKFRAWDDINKRWLMGYEEIGGFSLVGEAVACGEWESVLSGFIKGEFGEKGEGLIIQQFTGLKDRNGREIYEGDIIKIEFDANIIPFGGKFIMGEGINGEIQRRYYLIEVKWKGLGFNNFITPNRIGARGKETFEVIGDILETRELLEQ